MGADRLAGVLVDAYAGQGVTRLVVSATADDPAARRARLSAFASRYGLRPM